MNKKKILILCFLGDPTLPSGSLSGTGGFNASVKDLFDFLIRSNEFSCVFFTDTTGNYTEATTIQVSEKITFYRLFSPATNLIHKNNYIQEIDTYKAAIEAATDNFSNISFIHSFYWLSGLIASELSEKYNIPFIHTTISLSKQKMLSGYKPAISMQFEYESLFLNKAKYILAITEEEKRILVNYYSINESKIIVEGQSIAKEFYEPLYDNYGVPRSVSQDNPLLEPISFNKLEISDGSWWNSGAFTFVGRITQTKGLDIIIKAWIELEKKYNNSIPPLWIIGNTPYEIESFRNTLNIPLKTLKQYEHNKRIIWWGYLDSSAISTLFLKTAVLVTHSAFEAGGRVILEALCQGIPVISTNTGFGKDYIVNWQNGFIVDYGDTESLILRMSHFVANPILSSVLGKNAKDMFNIMDKNWNHSTRIKSLYMSMLREIDFDNTYKSNCTIKIDAFKKGIVTTYPYYYQKPTLEEISNFVKPFSKNNKNVLPEEYIEHSTGDIWNYENKIVIKNIYPKLNKRKIWDVSESVNVLSSSEIMDKCIISTKSKVILSPKKIDTNEQLIYLPYMSMMSQKEIIDNIYTIANCLKEFSKLSVQSVFPVQSLLSYWENTVKCIKQLGIKELTELYNKIPSSFHKHLLVYGNSIEKSCIQYMQSIFGHVGIYENKIHLLPTYHWKSIQYGYDEGMLLIDLLLYKNDLCLEDTYVLFKELSAVSSIQEIELLMWSLCICLEKMISCYIFKNEETVFVRRLYLFLLKIISSVI